MEFYFCKCKKQTLMNSFFGFQLDLVVVTNIILPFEESMLTQRFDST